MAATMRALTLPTRGLLFAASRKAGSPLIRACAFSTARSASANTNTGSGSGTASRTPERTPGAPKGATGRLRLVDQVAVVTGGGAGIGRETALAFAREGAKGVVVADLNDAAGQETVMLIQEEGGNAVFVKTNVASEGDIKKAVDLAEQKYGKLTVMFNNAGIMHKDDDNAMTTPETVWDMTFNVNVKGVWYGCKYAIPAMLRAGRGSIINTASFVGKLGAATPQLAYTSSKGAVLAMSRELAVIHARQGIRVNSLCPGPLRTELLMSFLNTDEKKQRRLVHVPMGRFGEAAEMAQAVVFLASDDSSYITGTDFLVDGGICSAYVTPL